jgi:anaerobic selenocysteine-containing dehydrogenase
LVNPGKLIDYIKGLDEIKTLSQDFAPEVVSAKCGIPEDTIRRLARELASSPQAIAYGRMGTCTQPFGTMNSWLVDVVNVLTGNLDRPGCVMFPNPATRRASSKKVCSIRHNRFQSRVRNIPEVLGEIPVSCLAQPPGTSKRRRQMYAHDSFQ